MSPPTSVCSPAPIVPNTERERTMLPRTTPSVLSIRYPSSVNAVVVIACEMAADMTLPVAYWICGPSETRWTISTRVPQGSVM